MVPSGILLSADSLKLKLMLAKNLDLRIMADAGCITPPAGQAAAAAVAAATAALAAANAPVKTTPRNSNSGSAPSSRSSSRSSSSPRVVLESPGTARVGVYTPEERLAMVARFRTKRQSRIWRKKIKYSCRKKLADSRPRIKGRFVKRLPGEEPQTVARAEAKLAEMARQKAASKTSSSSSAAKPAAAGGKAAGGKAAAATAPVAAVAAAAAAVVTTAPAAAAAPAVAAGSASA